MRATCANSKPVPLEETLAKLPPFSPVLTRLLALLANEDNVSFSRIAELVEHDTVLSGNILQMVNSALYGLRGTVKSVRHAIPLLGFNKIRNIALGLSVSTMWSGVKTAPGWSMARFNLHALAVAILADLLSQEVKVIDAEGAFVAGLLHDLGHLLIAVGYPNVHTEIMHLYLKERKTLAEAEQIVLNLDHAELSAEALRVWNLPPSIQIAVRFHHTPENDPSTCRRGEFRLSRLVNCAEAYVERAGVIMETLPGAEKGTESPLACFGLGDREAEVLDQFDQEFAAIRFLV